MKLNSHKTRHGHLVVKSTERNKQVKIDGVNDDGLKEFNDLLNQEPFATDGFPLYSKRFLDPKWKAIQDKLLDKAQGFGKLAMDETGTHRTRFTGVEECSDLEKSCDEWAKCRGVNIPKSEVKPEDIIPSKCNFTKGFREIIMDNVHNTIKLKEGEKVRIVPKVFNGTDYNVDGEDIVKKKQAKPLNESRSCDAQENFFIDSNGRDLIILEVTREMATGTIEAKTAFASAKIHVEVEKREDKSFPYKYVIIGVIIALVVIAIILLGLCCWCKCCRNRKSEESTKHSTTRGKSSKKKSSKKSGDDSNSNKEGELLSKEQSQNPVGSARPAYRVDKKKPKEPEKKKEVKVNLSPLDQDFFATPVEREVAETNIPIPVKAGAKDPFLICTDQENTGASPTPQPSDPKTERLSGEIANKVFGFATPAAEGAAAPSPAKNSLEAAAAAGTPAVPAAAAAIAAVGGVAASTPGSPPPDEPPKASDKEHEEKKSKETTSSKENSSKSDGKGDDKDKKKDKKEKKKDSKKKDDKKKDDKKDKKKKSDKKPDKKNTQNSGKTPKASPKKKAAAKPKATPKKSATKKKK